MRDGTVNTMQMTSSRYLQFRFYRIALAAFVALWIGGHASLITEVAQESNENTVTVEELISHLLKF